MDAVESQAEKKRQDKNLKYSRYHAIIAKVLETFVDAQKGTVLNNIPLQFGPFAKTVNLKVPLGLIIGDIQGGNKMCCSVASYSNCLS